MGLRCAAHGHLPMSERAFGQEHFACLGVPHQLSFGLKGLSDSL